MTASFPGGVADVQRGIGFTRLAGEEIVAIDLSNGTVRWRMSGVGRPIGVSAHGLVTIAGAGSRIDIAILDIEDGTARHVVPNVPIPAWVASELLNPDGFTATAVDREDKIEIVWRARRLYREGVPPPAASAGESKEVQGRFLIHAGNNFTLEEAAATSNETAQGIEPLFEAPMNVTLGDRTYTLETIVRSPSEISVMLRSNDSKSGSLIWENEIKRLPNKRPPPLRK